MTMKEPTSSVESYEIRTVAPFQRPQNAYGYVKNACSICNIQPVEDVTYNSEIVNRTSIFVCKVRCGAAYLMLGYYCLSKLKDRQKGLMHSACLFIFAERLNALCQPLRAKGFPFRTGYFCKHHMLARDSKLLCRVGAVGAKQ